MRAYFLVSGVYPHYLGGVSTWSDQIVNGLPDVEFDIVSIVSNPHVEIRYKLPPNVKEIVTIPLWGAERPEEYNHVNPLRFLSNSLNTGNSSIRKYFVPYFGDFIEEIVAGGNDSRLLGDSFYGMHQFARDHDYKKCIQSEPVWECFSSIIKEDEFLSKLNMFQSINILRTLGRFLRVLAFKPKKMDLCHSAIASVAGLVGIMAHYEYDTPNILTEHGVYYRERLLDLINQPLQFQAKFFWENFYKGLAKMNYHFADRIFPVCSFNSRWQQEFGISKNKIEVIYNGVDSSVFYPMDIERKSNDPTVAAIIRIDRLKDAINLIRAMKHVVNKIPNAKCMIYGPSPDKDYANLCLKVRQELELEDAVRFEGYTREPERAYNMGDVVVMSSISEGFPFALIEAMASGKAIVATNVGGMAEALGETGVLVPSRSPGQLGNAITKLLKDENQRRELGRKARMKSVNEYSIQGFIDKYREIYHAYAG
ncbi:MAG: GT4 family glycosyltransferase PelF [Thermoplasmata archaeon]|nr:MAG: GT4 family glycosyltransferase PelF [Thermoplasmata archaeon]